MRVSSRTPSRTLASQSHSRIERCDAFSSRNRWYTLVFVISCSIFHSGGAVRKFSQLNAFLDILWILRGGVRRSNKVVARVVMQVM